jgi:hypothetical protein
MKLASGILVALRFSCRTMMEIGVPAGDEDAGGPMACSTILRDLCGSVASIFCPGERWLRRPATQGLYGKGKSIA